MRWCCCDKVGVVVGMFMWKVTGRLVKMGMRVIGG
jgi:hypothetical protein